MNELHDQVLVSLRKIIRATDIHSRKLGKETGLTTPQLVVMRAIAQQERPVATEIAHSVSLSQATVTNILNRLESHELIQRSRSASDRRRINISLTPQGRNLLAAAPQPLQENFIERFGALEIWERHQLVASLERLASMMDAEHLDAAPVLTASEEMH
jgi:DNA-binding MarR family transcriptional regulator